MLELTGRTILLTGASRGIGAETARVLGERGANVIAHYGSQRAGVDAAIAGLPIDRRHVVQADLRDRDAAVALWRNAVSWQGHIDTLICNAAVMPPSALGAPDDDWHAAWHESYEVNVHQPATLIREAVRHFGTRGGGTIIVLSSWVAQRGASNPELGAYAASKAALGAFAKTIARAHARDNVLVHIVAPGVVATQMSVDAARAQGGEAAVTDALAMGEWVPPREVADLVAFLATGACRHLTGATLDVNGATYVR